ncbi:hypothetical protein [Flectobacillus longus]|uniref:hypothetical protein n=1 Tax=Flectobacillus longus TaxID=2984207 RepID=UPI0024B700E7|nr:hypothetical protein [Flectobacillus longus]MDI9882321.1 hypothetical protein [Flectobacillus longus]
MIKIFSFLIQLILSQNTYDRGSWASCISVQPDTVNSYKSTSNSYKNISRIGLNEFMDMDFRLIGYFPKKEQWNQISEQIKNIPIDSLRYVDSLDVSQLGDSLYVKVYTQNYAYQSKNVYTIAKDAKNLTDSLKIYNIYIDLVMKDFIHDSETFRTKDYTLNYVYKENIDKIDRRIIFHKIYH